MGQSLQSSCATLSFFPLGSTYIHICKNTIYIKQHAYTQAVTIINTCTATHKKTHLHTQQSLRSGSNYCIQSPCIPCYTHTLSTASCQITLYRRITKGIRHQFTRLIVRGSNHSRPLIHKKKKKAHSLFHVSTSNISLEINTDQLF